MWALRRAANPLSDQCWRIVVARGCCADVGILGRCPEYGGHDKGGKHMFGGHIFEKPYSQRSFLWSRNLSSKAGTKSNDSEDELDGLSDLETSPNTDKINDIRDLGGNVSEEEPHETADGELGLLDVEIGEQKAARSEVALSLFNILVETSSGSIKTALDTWVSEGKPLGRSEIYMVLLYLRRRRFYGKALQFTEWVETNKRLDFTERDYASHLDLIAKVHRIQKAEKFLDTIPQSFKTEVVYRTLLAKSVATGNIKKSEKIFKKMRDLGLPITTFACDQLLLLYKKFDAKKIADVLELMEKENVKPSVFTYRLLIDTKGRANDIAGMEELVEKMKADGMDPDIRIHAMLAKYYIYGKLNEKAEAELKEVEGDDITENRSACKELLALYASLGKSDEVERIWKVCEANPHPEECLAAIEAWGKLGSIGNAEQVFERLIKTLSKPSATYYNALIKVYANHKLLAKGNDLAKRMLENGCRFGTLTWDALVRLHLGAGEVEKADSILEKATQMTKMRPPYSSYIAVLENYAKRGDVNNAEKIFNKMRQSGYTRRIRYYKILLWAYANAKTPANGFRERMKADNMSPTKAMEAQLTVIDAFKKKETPVLLN